MAKRTVQTCRFYADIIQYLKLKGLCSGSSKYFRFDPSIDSSSSFSTMNQLQSFNNPSSDFELWNKFLTDIPQDTSSGIYAGILGHNYTSDDFDTMTEGTSVYAQMNAGTQSAKQIESFSSIVNYQYFDIPYKGYSMWNIEGWDGELDGSISSFRITVKKGSTSGNLAGIATYGRWFEPSNSPDLRVKLISEYDGITHQQTLGGNTITNVNNTGVPKWGNGLPAWSIVRDEDNPNYSFGENRPRRTWQVKFSYISSDNLFTKAQDPSQFFSYNADGLYDFNSSMGSFFALTLNGNIPFIFCPNTAGSDSDADVNNQDIEFAICRLDQDSLTFNQVAYQTWSVSMNIMEVW
tara:strand:- start:9493 stop:10542 length:1050 start_codon:yes stop_codon:yes gene_type:complete